MVLSEESLTLEISFEMPSVHSFDNPFADSKLPDYE